MGFYCWLCVVSHFQILREVAQLGLDSIENVRPFKNEDDDDASMMAAGYVGDDGYGEKNEALVEDDEEVKEEPKGDDKDVEEGDKGGEGVGDGGDQNSNDAGEEDSGPASTTVDDV